MCASLSPRSKSVWAPSQMLVFGTIALVTMCSVSLAAEIAPSFDVQLRPGNEFSLGEGNESLAIDAGRPPALPRKDVLMEFPLESIPDGRDIIAAELRLDVLFSATMTLNALGYAGDGLASLSDEFTDPNNIVGSLDGSFTPAEDIAIPLDVGFIDSLLGGSTHLGLRLVSGTERTRVNIASSESTTGTAPVLSLTFAPAPGDFDDNGVVDGFDFLQWQLDSSSNPLSQTHLADWETHYGETHITLSAVVAAVPEPSSCVLAVFSLAAMLATNRRARHSR